jgi:hypothetical protein
LRATEDTTVQCTDKEIGSRQHYPNENNRDRVQEKEVKAREVEARG